jgi:hypothetical protein
VSVTVRVSFRKQVSDGNYGTEAAECSFELEAEADESAGEVAEMLLAGARAQVHAELARSPSSNVRRALEGPRPPTPPDPVTELEDLPFD